MRKLEYRLNKFAVEFIKFRIPTDSTKRMRWIQKIREHQTIDDDSRFEICYLHFKSDDWNSSNGKIAENATPTIFQDEKAMKIINQDHENMEQQTCVKSVKFSIVRIENKI